MTTLKQIEARLTETADAGSGSVLLQYVTTMHVVYGITDAITTADLKDLQKDLLSSYTKKTLLEVQKELTQYKPQMLAVCKLAKSGFLPLAKFTEKHAVSGNTCLVLFKIADYVKARVEAKAK